MFDKLKEKLDAGVKVEIITLPYDSINTDVRQEVESKLRVLESKGAKILFDKWNVGDPSRTTTAVGRWHRNMELREKTKLSSRTLSKHLDEMVRAKVVERQVDNKSGKYPFPVFYRATPMLLAYTKSSLLREDFSQMVDAMLHETKDPLKILEVIHAYSDLGFLFLLKAIKNNENVTDEGVDFFEEVFLFSSYRSFIFDLVEASRRVLDNLDLEKLESIVKQRLST